mmetsp:Transcript_45585/g.146907  ORF Transcript_45585/g.146907 Transcript_45585/m.146907 type:complete len:546 (+) Transcript_45585:811-2448(+)
MPSLQRPSASASLPSWMAAYVCSILSAACERMSHRRKRSRSRSQSADFHAHSISSAGCDPGHAFAYSERSSHWLSAFAERTMPSSHSASSGCGVLTSVISPACHRLMHSAYASCAACHAPYCSSARARRVSACSARCFHTAACPSRSPSALCREASASYHAGSVGARASDCCSSGIARCHALCRAASERKTAPLVSVEPSAEHAGRVAVLSSAKPGAESALVRHVRRLLLQRGFAEVRSASPADERALHGACQGAHLVVDVAVEASDGSASAGTASLLGACARWKVPAVILCSDALVGYDASADVCDGDELSDPGMSLISPEPRPKPPASRRLADLAAAEDALSSYRAAGAHGAMVLRLHRLYSPDLQGMPPLLPLLRGEGGARWLTSRRRRRSRRRRQSARHRSGHAGWSRVPTGATTAAAIATWAASSPSQMRRRRRATAAASTAATCPTARRPAAAAAAARPRRATAGENAPARPAWPTLSTPRRSKGSARGAPARERRATARRTRPRPSRPTPRAPSPSSPLRRRNGRPRSSIWLSRTLTR